ncbi:hypothetical protein TNCV_382991 [Trichonephila clavipes]|nr:hypothetical protein TNCV_382991 [Trichonephila clavipes]
MQEKYGNCLVPVPDSMVDASKLLNQAYEVSGESYIRDVGTGAALFILFSSLESAPMIFFDLRTNSKMSMSALIGAVHTLSSSSATNSSDDM